MRHLRALLGRNILHLIQVSLRKRGKFACAPLTSFWFPYFFLSLFLQHLSWGSVGVPVLQTEVIWVREATAAVEAASAIETSAQEASVTWDSTMAWFLDVEDRVA
jgi:predicted MFS family arabinose efflux permease